MEKIDGEGYKQVTETNEGSGPVGIPETRVPEQGTETNGDAHQPRRKRTPRAQTFSERWRRMSLPNKLMFFATVVIAVAAVVNIIVVIVQMIGNSSQTNRVIAADERIAQAMEGSVDQAKIAFDGANKQAILSQRAWLATGMHVNAAKDASGNVPADPLIVGKELDLQVRFKNTGRTPALNLRTVTARTGVEGKNGVFDKPDFKYHRDWFVFGGNLTPDGEIYGDSAAMFTQLDKERISSLKVRVFLHGRAEYDDVFGSPHWQNFCGFLLPSGAFAVCPYHNDMDPNPN